MRSLEGDGFEGGIPELQIASYVRLRTTNPEYARHHETTLDRVREQSFRREPACSLRDMLATFSLFAGYPFAYPYAFYNSYYYPYRLYYSYTRYPPYGSVSSRA